MRKLNMHYFGWVHFKFTADFIFGKKRVLVNYANDLTVKGSAILLFQTVKFICWSLFNKENILDRVHTYSVVTAAISCFS